jgi:signal transduction histidine kinase
MKKEAEIKSLKEKNKKLLGLSSKRAEIISVNAHQIRTSLSAIKWILRMFINGDLGKLNTEQENLMKKADENNDRAIEIVSKLLLANKNENIVEKKYNFKEINIVELIDDSIFDFSGETHTKEIEILFLKPDKEPLMIFADKEKLRIVFQNLLENAIKYSNKKGKVFVALKKKDNFIEVSIKDTGIGISEEGKSKMFGKFYRDKEAEQREIFGTGIGLFTAKKIVEDHKGKIWFESDKGEGTTFFFTIPIPKTHK